MKKELKISIVVVIVLLIIGLIIFLSNRQEQINQTGKASVSQEVPADMAKLQSEEAAEATQQLIDETISDSNQEPQVIKISEISGEGDLATTTVKEIKVVVVAPGTSAIDTNTGTVVTPAGQAVSNDAQAGTGSAPQQSFPMKAEDLPKSTIKLDVVSSGFTPKEFTVKPGQAVSLAVSNVNESTFSEVFRFDDPSLSAVVLGLAKGETKTITFNAPTKAGEYTFFSDMFDHRAQGAVGKMIVK